jgi:hypothetical protein
MKIHKRIITIITLISTLCLFCCTNKEKKTNKEFDIVLEIEDASLFDNLIYYRFPSPHEIFEYIKLSEIDYKSEAINPASNYDNYLDSYSQTLNMGIYISDLAYITMFDQQEESLEYFEAIHYLSEAIKISAALEDPLLDRLSQNIDNIDSLVIIANDAYKSIVDYLIDNELGNKLALLSIGAFIETLYLTTIYIDPYSSEITYFVPPEIINLLLSVVSNLVFFTSTGLNSSNIF